MIDLGTRVAMLSELKGISKDDAMSILLTTKDLQSAYVGINTLVVDVDVTGSELPGVVVPGLEVREGDLFKSGIVDLHQYGLTDDHLSVANLGGQGNIVPVAAKLLSKDVHSYSNMPGVVGFLGDDAFSNFFRERMEDLCVNTFGLINTGQPVGTSIMVRGENDRSGIAYFYRANGTFDGTSDVREKLLIMNPIFGHNSYVGLSPEGWDKNGGANLADFLKFQWDLDMVVCTDTHTFGEQQLEEFRRLEVPLRYTHIFICSGTEADRIMAAWGITPPETQDRVELAKEFVGMLGDKYFFLENNQPRIFGVSMRDGVVAAYKSADGQLHAPKLYESNYSGIPGVNWVGAGDSLKTGLGAYIIENNVAFRGNSGEVFNLAEALGFACSVATAYVSTPDDWRGLRRFDQISHYDAHLAVERSGKKYDNLEEFTGDLEQVA